MSKVQVLKTASVLALLTSVGIGGGIGMTSAVFSAEQKVGATLNDKQSLALSDIPEQALSAIKAIEAEFVPKEAEKEFKHEKTYLDIEGEVDGREIEFDMLQTQTGWQVVEVQRDLSMSQLPPVVLAAIDLSLPQLAPKRIIESVQYGTDITVYELYSVDEAGKESRTEVKLENGVASILDEEWAH